jgi:hypothetical protein
VATTRILFLFGFDLDQLLPRGYSICLVFLKLFDRVYAPLTAGLLNPMAADARLERRKRSLLDSLYQKVTDDLDNLVRAVGLKAAYTLASLRYDLSKLRAKGLVAKVPRSRR